MPSVQKPLTRPLASFWGKLRKDEKTSEIVAWLPLAEHCLDLAQVFRDLTKLPLLRRRLAASAHSEISGAQLDRLAVIALLHDLGKANLGFQDKPFAPHARQVEHVRELAPLFFDSALNEALARNLDLDTLSSWFQTPAELECFLTAAWSHHGLPVQFDPAIRTGVDPCWWRPEDGGRDPMATVAHLMTVARRNFPAAFADADPPLTGHPGLQHRFAGLVMLADWFGSHETFFPIDRPLNFDRAQAAHEAVSAVGLETTDAQATLAAHPTSFVTRFGYPPHPLQAVVDELPTDDPVQRLLIAEAETGSGKTEAALARFFRLFAAGEVDSLYFALPTRVAARELYARVCDYLERVLPDPQIRPAAVLAVPGYARVDNIPVKRLLLGPGVRWDDAADQRRRERTWAAEHPKRFLAAAVAVGTIDQALLSALQTRHAHMRSVCLDRSLLVVDEVHASDPYMRRLLKGLLTHHLGLGGHALLLSARGSKRERFRRPNSQKNDERLSPTRT